MPAMIANTTANEEATRSAVVMRTIFMGNLNW
jgi:hypothetical protein